MAADTSAERTEQATPRRREKARKEGQVARSAEVSSAVMMLVLAWSADWWLGGAARDAVRFAKHSFSLEAWSGRLGADSVSMLRAGGGEVFRLVLPVAVIAAVLGLFANLAQVGIGLNPELIGPRWNRMDPTRWVRKMFSPELPVDLLKSMLKTIGVVLIVGLGMQDELQQIWRLSLRPAAALGSHMSEIAASSFWRAAAAMGLLAALDVLWTRYRHAKKLRMSRQEVKDEMKDQEVDPHVKNAIRRQARDRSRGRLAQAVGEASVIVTNPTHFAVALRYDNGRDPSPRVIAKGRGFRAARIRELAREHRVPLMEDRPLARALYSVKIGQMIPLELYRAVARLLAAVYRRQGKIPRHIDTGQRRNPTDNRRTS